METPEASYARCARPAYAALHGKPNVSYWVIDGDLKEQQLLEGFHRKVNIKYGPASQRDRDLKLPSHSNIQSAFSRHLQRELGMRNLILRRLYPLRDSPSLLCTRKVILAMASIFGPESDVNPCFRNPNKELPFTPDHHHEYDCTHVTILSISLGVIRSSTHLRFNELTPDYRASKPA